MPIVMLDANTLGDSLDFSPLEELGELIIHKETRADQVVERLHKAEITITNKQIFDKNIFRELPKLKFIALCATGYNNVNLDAAQNSKIGVANVRGYSTESVAQHTFAMLLYLLQQLAYYDRYVKEGSYQKSPSFTHIARPWYEISGKQWGIIGLGAIGRRVAILARAFGAKVAYTSPSGTARKEAHPHLPLEELLASSDIVSIHAPLNDHTQGLIGFPEITRMKKKAYLLNLGRGGIVDEEALVEALNQDLIAGAGLDVLRDEPIKENSPLLSALANPDKLLLTPHNAWGSNEARATLVQELAKNIRSFQTGGKRNRII